MRATPAFRHQGYRNQQEKAHGPEKALKPKNLGTSGKERGTECSYDTRKEETR